MRYSEWLREIEKVREKTEKLLVDEEVLCDSVKIGENAYKIFLGDRVQFYKNDKREDSDFRMDYGAKEHKWQELLGGLQTKVTMAEALNKKLLTAMVEPYMKEAVMERLVGDAPDIQDNETILRTCVAKRLNKLNKTIPECYISAEFTLNSPSKNYDLSIHYSWHSALVKYGALESLSSGILAKVGMKNCWSLLCNFDEITVRVNEFSTAMKQVTKLLAKEQ